MRNPKKELGTNVTKSSLVTLNYNYIAHGVTGLNLVHEQYRESYNLDVVQSDESTGSNEITKETQVKHVRNVYGTKTRDIDLGMGYGSIVKIK